MRPTNEQPPASSPPATLTAPGDGAAPTGQVPDADRGQLSIASLNTRGIPLLGSQLAQRYRLIADAFESSSVDIICLQEVFTYHHLRLLLGRMASFPHVSYRPSLLGPAGGLLTLSRRKIAERRYRRFPDPPVTPGLSRLTRLKARLKGTLLTELTDPGVCILNTHPAANTDGDWSSTNRFHPLHQTQLAGLAQAVAEADQPTIVCGDFNISRDSDLHQELLASTTLVDAFDGRCPPTFRAEYLDNGKAPHCIDFILVSPSLEVEQANLILTEPERLPSGPIHLSDHVGLHATIAL
jgi:sphingomyelin phosphodiesterase 2